MATDVVYNIDFTVNEFITLTQNARLASNAPMVALNIDYSLTLEVADLAALFPVTYQQNAANSELYDIDVSMNPVALETYLGKPQPTGLLPKLTHQLLHLV